jgi:Putative bacterial sensory transduction regulator
MSELHDAASLAVVARQLDEWLDRFDAEHPEVEAIDRAEPGDVAPGERRWYVRMRGEDKDFTTVWLTLGQRTLRYETYVMPAPEEQHERLYEQLLRHNDRLVGAHFSVGAENAVFLRGELPLAALDEAELDRILGSLYAYVERWFRTLLRIGFASRLRDGR